MKRRQFITSAAAAGVAGAAASTFPKPAISQGLMEWKMVTSWPKGLPGLGTGAQRLADSITAMSGGRLTVKLYAAGELVPALQCMDAVSSGTAELGHDAPYYHLGKNVGFGFFTAFPFGLTGSEMTGWINHGGGQALWDELAGQFNIKPFQAGNTSAQMFGWFRKEITSVEDLKGLKYRTAGINAMVLTKLGATVVLLPGGEIFQALQSGAVDAAEWVGPYNDLALGLYQVAPYYYTPGFAEPGAAFQLMVNKQKYEALPNDLKAILRYASQAANDSMYGEFQANSGPALKTLVQKHKVQLKQLPRDIMIAMGNAAAEVLADIQAKDPMAKKISESFLAFRETALPWSQVGEMAQYSARTLPFDLVKKS